MAAGAAGSALADAPATYGVSKPRKLRGALHVLDRLQPLVAHVFEVSIARAQARASWIGEAAQPAGLIDISVGKGPGALATPMTRARLSKVVLRYSDLSQILKSQGDNDFDCFPRDFGLTVQEKGTCCEVFCGRDGRRFVLIKMELRAGLR